MTPDSFAAFYALYPRHVARKAAEKAWARCATSPEAIEQIMAGLRAQLPFMKANDKKFVPHPATWLNQQRFQDEEAWAGPPPRACDICGDTGVRRVIYRRGQGMIDELARCLCPAGQLPGLMTGPIDPRDLPPTEPERDAP